MVASSPSTAVTAIAAANTSASSRGPDPRACAAIRAASASNNPARSQPSPIASSDASTTSVGASARASSLASSHDSTPATISSAAPPSATAASGTRSKRTTAAAIAATSAIAARITSANVEGLTPNNRAGRCWGSDPQQSPEGLVALHHAPAGELAGDRQRAGEGAERLLVVGGDDEVVLVF